MYVVIAGFFEKEGDLQTQFKKAADSLNEDFGFAFTSDKGLLEKYGFKK